MWRAIDRIARVIVYCKMIQRKYGLILYIIIALLAMTNFLWQPCLFIRGNGAGLAMVPVMGELPFSISFLHSVQKTPVEENLVAMGDGRGFRLLSTKYQSFGVGLPFLESEGSFRQEGNFYVFEGMDRSFSQLSVRTGVGTKLVIRVAGREYRLYEQFAPGTRIDIFVVPVYEYIWKGAHP